VDFYILPESVFQAGISNDLNLAPARAKAVAQGVTCLPPRATASLAYRLETLTRITFQECRYFTIHRWKTAV